MFVESADMLLARQIEELRVESKLPHDDGAGGEQTPQIHEVGGSLLRIDQGQTEGAPLLGGGGADGKCRNRNLWDVQGIDAKRLIQELIAPVAAGENIPVSDGGQS
ncbi:MAG: hypothetical protein ACKV0T_10000 [Planctomycetales bacterium]